MHIPLVSQILTDIASCCGCFLARGSERETGHSISSTRTEYTLAHQEGKVSVRWELAGQMRLLGSANPVLNMTFFLSFHFFSLAWSLSTSLSYLRKRVDRVGNPEHFRHFLPTVCGILVYLQV